MYIVYSYYTLYLLPISIYDYDYILFNYFYEINVI